MCLLMWRYMYNICFCGISADSFLILDVSLYCKKNTGFISNIRSLGATLQKRNINYQIISLISKSMTSQLTFVDAADLFGNFNKCGRWADDPKLSKQSKKAITSLEYIKLYIILN